MPTLQEAIDEAYEEANASNTNNTPNLETIEINHPTFDKPARYINGTDEDMELPLEIGGDPVEFLAAPLAIVLPGQSPDGITPAKLRVADPTGVLPEYFDMATEASDPFEIIIRIYRPEQLEGPADIITGLFVFDVDHDKDAAQGTIGFKEIEMASYPNITYSTELWPALGNN